MRSKFSKTQPIVETDCKGNEEETKHCNGTVLV
jgi:hypothetical protein